MILFLEKCNGTPLEFLVSRVVWALALVAMQDARLAVLQDGALEVLYLAYLEMQSRCGNSVGNLALDAGVDDGEPFSLALGQGDVAHMAKMVNWYVHHFCPKRGDALFALQGVH